ncbi:MAG: bifunctional tRNA (5-methylaminomethyl-2-thiouridine)(34)-methyltransferase MnmD/FAD-dependent 5-carboxymethylaminomethyl-2-thiouridine(34) oxidoreductase MnmC [Azonexus sp.]|uniref:bifunctional tRNA (5-methylaminomethyl-2-thiouridine)(34)-methyltransferase MnmD/FAD-dependent 5-carboxymethylaminomethyl-2-thiouridine(34) oxidoreductase MnmC n=1 Tax=Azonexus sp. TaxID=1872668 RepID=UPI00282F929B|nr:bifunctional tRNA (5-methylaminomethyl-2-thiouridine)(34)-methyltransferase MnmD/FAD-dependent 5-carboxymethylaminomethyl-2-thiouridine(34) oxidoreductase MnmC [Azonexus sp.]MDR0776951.1 bifunctional tRNA (5-methylaminomethyl-2-thiouridine)(34)-methyltransferase MnmD/FAD-dependent 5-carboxymethylaminomethyl-2-thiouridine(34) oxidoreductase MnmC [Azonexus sp.]
MDKLAPAHLEFAPDGTPFSAAYGDVYHSAHGGPAQARHVFLAGNDLPTRWHDRQRFVILETGFGLGLNFLATWQAWRDDPRRCRRLHFVSIEKHPFTASDLAVAQRAWPEFAALAELLQQRWPPLTPGMHRLYFADDQLTLTLLFGDAATRLGDIDVSVDAFYLDGFSPAKNPELWTPSLCRGLARMAAPGATLATWSVAGELRAALEAAEFDLEKRPGFAGKRQMLAGRFRSRRPERRPLPAERQAIVIGAGIAGSTAAHRLAAAGWQVTVLEQAAGPGYGASSNLAGMLRPLPSADDNRLSRLTRAGFLATRALLETLPAARWSPCGVLHLAREAEHEAQQRRTVEQLGLPPELLQYLDRDAASQCLGQPVKNGGWWFPSAGWVQPPSVCRAALAAFPERIDCRFSTPVAHLEADAGGWRVLAADGRLLAAAPVLIMASGAAAPGFAQFAWLPQRVARGQVSHLPASATPALDTVLFQIGYAMPEVDGVRLIGASFSYEDEEAGERLADHADNLARLRLLGFAAGIDPATLSGRVGFRPMSPDRLPIVGPMPLADAAANRRLRNLPTVPGLWCVQGFGARGIVWSALMADLLVSRLEGEPLPLERDLADAVSPGRFLIRHSR